MNLFNQVFKSLMFWTSFPKSNSKFSLLYAVSSWPTAALYEAINSVCMPGDGLVTQSLSDSFRFHGLLPARLLCPVVSPGKNTGVGCQARLQGIFPTQGSNPCLSCLLHWQAGSWLQSHLGSEWAFLTSLQWGSCDSKDHALRISVWGFFPPPPALRSPKGHGAKAASSGKQTPLISAFERPNPGCPPCSRRPSPASHSGLGTLSSGSFGPVLTLKFYCDGQLLIGF